MQSATTTGKYGSWKSPTIRISLCFQWPSRFSEPIRRHSISTSLKLCADLPDSSVNHIRQQGFGKSSCGLPSLVSCLVYGTLLVRPELTISCTWSMHFVGSNKIPPVLGSQPSARALDRCTILVQHSTHCRIRCCRVISILRRFRLRHLG